ncbi:hypothetical protein Ciccas_011498, partial [Cichlidogyrus casuarinus]
ESSRNMQQMTDAFMKMQAELESIKQRAEKAERRAVENDKQNKREMRDLQSRLEQEQQKREKLELRMQEGATNWQHTGTTL